MTVLERELKLAAGPGFLMPDLDGLADGVTASPQPPERLSTTYLDTNDLHLARWGVSFRHRVGQGWTVKLPSEGNGALLARAEVTFAGSGRRPPAGAIDLVRAFIRSDELRPQTRLRTLRTRTELRGLDGHLVADVVDDEVSVLEGRRLATRFRELEVEVGYGTPLNLVEEIVELLRRAGAGAPDPTPKYIRALGARAERPPEIVLDELGSEATAGDAVRRALAASVVRLIEHDPVMRLDTDAEGVHQARVSTRRLRSDLRTFRTLVDPAWAAALRDELGWLAGILGSVRDGDVLLERMCKRASQLPETTARGAARVIRTLEASREDAHAELLATLRDERYLSLLDQLVSAANEPALAPEAEVQASTVLPGLVRRPWRSLADRVTALGKRPSDEDLHDIRIRTKRVRYAAEAVAPLVGKRAGAFAAAAARLQEVLGDLNDAVVAEAWLREWASRSRSLQGVFAAGELAGLERAAADRRRSQWEKAWKELSAPKLRSWM